MDTNALKHLWPDLPGVAESLTASGIGCRILGSGGDRRFRDVRRFRPGDALAPEILYVIDADPAGAFPEAGHCCVGVAPVPAQGQILCEGCEAPDLLDRLMALFQRGREQEARLDELVFQGAELQELCDAGSEMLGVPLVVHDDWFMILARAGEEGPVHPAREGIPGSVIEDFKHDPEYRETYRHHDAQLWTGSPGQPACVYVNLWEGNLYRGRLLAIQTRRALNAWDCRLAEVLAQRMMSCLRRSGPGREEGRRSMDDIVYDLLTGREVESRESQHLLSSLGWRREDQVLLVQMRSQQTGDSPLMDRALHGELFHALPQAYILFSEGEQWALVNLSREDLSLPMLRHRLAPLCRDYCLYAGLSSPVAGILDWPAARRQAQIALNRAFELRSERWMVSFSECAMDHMIDSLQPPLRPRHLIAPEILRLKRHDDQHGTCYFETLRAWLNNERSVPRTSEALIIHRTTLLYRLRRIAALVDLDLEDPWRRLYLTLSFKLMEREE